MDRDEQIKIVKQLRERFEDDVYRLLQDWVDASRVNKLSC